MPEIPGMSEIPGMPEISEMPEIPEILELPEKSPRNGCGAACLRERKDTLHLQEESNEF